MEFRSLENTDFDTLFNGFERAFADYEISFEKEEVRSMLVRRGYDPRLSFAAFDDGGIVTFTLNGTGLFDGIPTAYDTGTGTASEYRGRGLAYRIFSHAVPHLREAGIRQYLLEVLQNNHKAIAVYRRMNFETTREFDCYRQSVDAVVRSLPDKCADCVVETTAVDAIGRCADWCDFAPSWQNSIDSIRRGKDSLTCLVALTDGIQAGYCVFDANTGDLTQIAVDPRYRRRGIASRLLREAVGRLNTDFVKVLNVSSDNRTMPSFLASRDIVPASRQYEMILQIPS